MTFGRETQGGAPGWYEAGLWPWGQRMRGGIESVALRRGGFAGPSPAKGSLQSRRGIAGSAGAGFKLFSCLRQLVPRCLGRLRRRMSRGVFGDGFPRVATFDGWVVATLGCITKPRCGFSDRTERVEFERSSVGLRSGFRRLVSYVHRRRARRCFRTGNSPCLVKRLGVVGRLRGGR
jgi:hypothetical protein